MPWSLLARTMRAARKSFAGSSSASALSAKEQASSSFEHSLTKHASLSSKASKADLKAELQEDQLRVQLEAAKAAEAAEKVSWDYYESTDACMLPEAEFDGDVDSSLL